MGLLDNLLRAMTSHPEVSEIDESERLRLEVVQLYQEGRFPEAEQSARRLVELQRELGAEQHPDHATALSNLALILQQQGDLESAEPLLRQALEIRREALGETHPDHANSLNNLALLYCERHDIAAAEPLLRQALEVRRLALGEEHPDYATGLGSLALLYCERHDLDAAEPLLRRALEIRRAALGEEHPDYATSLNNLALLLCERQQLDDAEPLLRRALEIRSEMLGDQHPDTRSSAESLSMILIRKGATGTPAADSKAGAAGQSRKSSRGNGASTKPSPGADPHGGGHGRARARNAAALVDDFAALSAAFQRAAEQMLHEAARMQTPGLPPNVAVLSSASACHRDFATLKGTALELAKNLLARSQIADRIASLEDLRALIDTLTQAEAALAVQEETRRRALDVLEQVLALSSLDPAYERHLDQSQQQARFLHTALASCPAFELPQDAERLSRGEHPIAGLLVLFQDDDQTTSEAWSEAYKETVAAFGQPLAVAAARGKLVRVERGGNQPRTPAPKSSTVAARLEAEPV